MTAVADTSVLIALARLNLLSLLHELFGDMAIPDAVADEALRFRADAPANTFIVDAMNHGWLHIEPTRPPAEFLGKLGSGEREAIHLARAIAAEVVIIDDLSAHRAASELGLEVTGTAGVLKAARGRGMIEAAAPLLVRLRSQGFHIGDELIDEIRQEEEHGS